MVIRYYKNPPIEVHDDGGGNSGAPGQAPPTGGEAERIDTTRRSRKNSRVARNVDHVAGQVPVSSVRGAGQAQEATELLKLRNSAVQLAARILSPTGRDDVEKLVTTATETHDRMLALAGREPEAPEAKILRAVLGPELATRGSSGSEGGATHQTRVALFQTGILDFIANPILFELRSLYLAQVYIEKFELTDEKRHLDEAKTVLESSVESLNSDAFPGARELIATILASLSTALVSIYEEDGRQDDLTYAVKVAERADAMAMLARPATRAALGSALRLRSLNPQLAQPGDAERSQMLLTGQ